MVKKIEKKKEELEVPGPGEQEFVEKEVKKVDVWKLKKYTCKVKTLGIYAGGKNIIVLNTDEAESHDIYAGYRTEIKTPRQTIIGIVDLSTTLIKPGEIGVYTDFAKEYHLKDGEVVEIVHMDRPASISYIRKKLDKETLNENEIMTIVQEIMENKLSDAETSAFITATYINGMADSEIIALTNATVASGESLNLGKKPILDKHCIPADVPTIVRNSNNVKVEPIGKIAEKIFERCKDRIHFDDGAEYVEGDLNGLQVLTYDGNGNTKFSPVSRVYRVKSPGYLYELTLLGNRVIRATSDHTVFILRNGKIINEQIKKLKAGDYVVVPSSLEIERPLTFLKTKFGIRNYKKFDDTLPISKEFMRLLGYYISEGFTNSQGIFFDFGSHEKDLIEDAVKCVRKVFGVPATLNKPHKNAIRICVHNKTISKIFEESIKAGSSATEKRIPSFIFDVNREMKLEFLKALFRGGGYVRQGYRAVYVTASKALASDLQYLLSLMGASVSLSRRDRKEAFYIYTQAREIFGGRQKANVASLNLLPIKELGEIEKEKISLGFRKRLEEQQCMTKKKLSAISHAIKSPDVKKLLNGNLSVLKVKSLRKIKSTSEYVYDFKVPGHEKFVAGSAPICIHNCIGGVAGNRTTMVITPIIAAAGLYIPKTSSRAITSAAGTADTMEVLANVTFSMEELREIVLKTKGAIVWGGGMKLAPVDDKLIRIRHPLSLDPEGMLLASILGKKRSVGATHIIIDIPVGRGVKIPYYEKGVELGKHFIRIGNQLGMKVEVLITDGAEPVGNGVGPVLECIDVLHVLNGKGPEDLRHKSILMAGKLLELCGKVEKGAGYSAAENLITSGKALKKFQEIIEAQGGNPRVTVDDLPVGKYAYTVKSKVSGSIFHIDNHTISKIARIAGAPKSKGAGVLLHKTRGSRVEVGDSLFTIYAEKEDLLDYAIKALEKLEPVEMRKMLLGSMVE